MRPTAPPTIAELPIPARIGTPESAAFEEMVAVMNGVAVALWHNDDFVYTAEAELASFQAREFHDKIVFVAVVDGVIVGRVVVDFPLEEDAVTATLLVDVVPGMRGRGIGSALLAHGEEFAADGGRTAVSAYTEHPAATLHDGPVVRAEVGTSALPADSPDVRFALRHGYRLGQIERSSSLALPLTADRRDALLTDVRTHSRDYRTVSWWRSAPGDRVAAFAALKERMTVDVPQSGIALDDEEWTADRVRQHEDELIARGEPLLVTVAEHVPSGALVAYTEIAVPDDGDKAEQYDTLVATDHRGHRLGTLVKLENLERLAERAPHIRRLLTWNADENAPMLRVNDAFGFELHGLTGNWQKSLD
ncbi:GNAT family N-acetyltransferase [Leifsonia poae]|uniref:GNAT family N-acetyltransferase n=1 Tax=Leifsonia poae TaxID=110933 RepID=A0A9W6HDH6_9MICO|nr:GNAT family N-acetyltransferase [Leifsonia poae]GLJ77753.1 GNAT family N-acetyltransferase [Leifsonia poae]